MCVVEALGTIWVVSHDETKRFDAEDLRVMTSLSKFASAAYQTLLSANARDMANDVLLETVTTAQRFAFIVESSDDAIISKTLDGVITSWNGGAERIFGYSAEEALGQHITILIPPDRIDEETRIIESLRQGKRVPPFDTIRLRKDGEQVHVSVTISPVKISMVQSLARQKLRGTLPNANWPKTDSSPDARDAASSEQFVFDH